MEDPGPNWKHNMLELTAAWVVVATDDFKTQMSVLMIKTENCPDIHFLLQTP